MIMNLDYFLENLFWWIPKPLKGREVAWNLATLEKGERGDGE